ncbi:MAG: class I SAM-dependent methyltransferase [Halioglobus sp.]|nr:class I SAM-dependent methyltransferase [Halioglobus sp.]
MARYDTIGRGYAGRRRPDARIAAALHAYLRGNQRILNIGAGTGSYEPAWPGVVAVEPSRTMIGQRPAGAAPVVQGVAESLPFADDSFDLAMGVLTLHHWSDWRQGLREALRVAGGRVVLLTWFDFTTPFWLCDYFPQIHELDRPLFPGAGDLADTLGEIEVQTVPVPHDCSDGFLCAYWRRPQAYLDPAVRASISTFARIPDPEGALQRLRHDLDSGDWDRRYGDLRALGECDYGYRIVSTVTG